ncbi:NIPSNAP family protein [Frateuria terrea]|uniref:NIPSNAP protein n=1 Tax=Frateuria terrea TaxID=529704 RepID=A0A1H6SVQ1_9GAMM|nr:NIPSNAP family protein [Frateuria terrea]SEI72028.1 NIPSNAP protein [Frateuria terrea]SFP29041.1 NIPSNAP protein [Frateuria terrea]
MSGHSVFELRQYTLRSGQRALLIELFEREFVEAQEALGIGLPGQFRDLDDPDRFVWLRSFADMEARAAALAAFYDGPVWRAHREAANATMLDSDDVLLLRPVHGFALDGLVRPTADERAPAGLLTATICPLPPGDAAALVRSFDAQVRPALEAHGTPVLAQFVTEPACNTYPRLPVREGECVLVWFAAFGDTAAQARREAAAAADPAIGAWIRRLDAMPQILRLAPTQRSLLRDAAPASTTPRGHA